MKTRKQEGKKRVPNFSKVTLTPSKGRLALAAFLIYLTKEGIWRMNEDMPLLLSVVCFLSSEVEICDKSLAAQLETLVVEQLGCYAVDQQYILGRADGAFLVVYGS